MRTVPLRWKKSSRSAQDAECVELAYDGLVRDSKNPTGSTLEIDRGGMLAAVKAGRFDR